MKKVITLLAVSALFSESAFAHEMANSGGFLAGFNHPVLGFDHLLAMLSIGLLSAQIGGKAIWTVPLAFVSMMLVGGILGINGIPVGSVELGIMLSVLLLGIALAAAKKFPPIVAMLFAGVFAIFHGHAHGTEMPTLSEPALYALGFVTGTAAIHIAGVVIGVFLETLRDGKQLLRYFGAGIAGIGFHLLVM